MFRGLRVLTHPIQRQYALRMMSSYPPHTVVGLPSLSPTMASGTIGKWTCKVGDKIAPGDQLAEVETDKAHVPFEAQDEFYIAKILVAEGSEVKVGDPILITVEDESAVSSFSNYAVAAATPAPAPVATPVAPKVEEKPKPVEAPKPQPVQVAAPVAPQPVVEAPKPKPVAPVAAAAPAAKASKATQPSLHWGSGVKSSPLTKKLGLDQQAYINKYGRTGHKPIFVETKAEK